MNPLLSLVSTYQTMGASESVALLLARWTGMVSAVLVGLIAYLVVGKLLISVLTAAVKRSKNTWDALLLQSKLPVRLACLVPAMVVKASVPLFLAGAESAAKVVLTAIGLYVIVAGLLVFNAAVALVSLLHERSRWASRFSIKGGLQALKLLACIVAAVLALSALFGKHPGYFISGLGAMTAVLLLVFKDSILGLVAGVQLSALDMVRVGDWIEMPKHGADGDVIDVSLTTVRVQNWDKTITAIPSYALISQSFHNWRGMQESGGRRIKRAIHLDISTVCFCDQEMIDRFERIRYISDYIAAKKAELAEHNARIQVSDADLVNARRLTNIGTFRAYVTAYLRNHPNVHQDMTFLIRQLPPTEHGLPLQIYVFTNDIVWANYEGIQSDIFDHLLAIVPEFDLRVYQQPSGKDVTEALTGQGSGV